MADQTNAPNDIKPVIEEGRDERHAPSLTVFMTGSFSAVLCSVLLQPLDVLKTRLQNPGKPQKGKPQTFRMFRILKKIYMHENLKVLWYGTTATVLRGIPGGGLYFCVYDWMKSNFFPREKPNTYQIVFMGIVARAVTDVAIIPLTVVKTRIESGLFKYGFVISGLAHIYKTEGVAGLTSGLLPVLVRDLPMSGIYIFFYNGTQTLVPKTFYDNHGNVVHSTSAAVAAVLSAVATHPPDVIKTQMQLYPKKYPTIYSVIQKLYTEHGIMGYFQGISPRLLKRTVFAIISWTLYEHVKSN